MQIAQCCLQWNKTLALAWCSSSGVYGMRKAKHQLEMAINKIKAHIGMITAYGSEYKEIYGDKQDWTDCYHLCFTMWKNNTKAKAIENKKVVIVEYGWAKLPGKYAKPQQIPGWEKEVLQGFNHCWLLTIVHHCSALSGCPTLTCKSRGTWPVDNRVWNLFKDIRDQQREC